MTAQHVHQLDVVVAYVTIVSWAFLMILLEQVADRRVAWVKLASFGPLYRGCEHLPETWGPLHVVLVIAAVLWLGALLFPVRKLRPWLFSASAGCLVFLATAWALA